MAYHINVYCVPKNADCFPSTLCAAVKKKSTQMKNNKNSEQQCCFFLGSVVTSEIFILSCVKMLVCFCPNNIHIKSMSGSSWRLQVRWESGCAESWFITLDTALDWLFLQLRMKYYFIVKIREHTTHGHCIKALCSQIFLSKCSVFF